jgi:uncharacterized protein YaaQ
MDPHNVLLIVVVQAQDVENAQNAIQGLGVPVTRLPSVGGFLGLRNATLLIGAPQKNHQAILDKINENCRQRVEYFAVPLESAPLPIPTPTPITVGGATIFSIEIDHMEVI